MIGPRQHTLPASYLAGFSDTRRRRARESLLWVGRRGKPSIYRQKAANLCYSKDIYTLTRPILVSALPWNPSDLDAMWATVERQLTIAIASLVRERAAFFDARLWLVVLVEFAAQVFVRGDDFGKRFVSRISAISPQLVGLFHADHSDHINGARLLELHRLRGAILQAEWTILHARDGCFVSNDLARTPVIISEERVGYLIPLRSDAALLLTLGPNCPAMQLRPADTEDKWLVGPIRHDTISDSGLARFNDLLAYSARSEIYGSPESLVRSLHASMDSTPLPLEEAEPAFLSPFRDLGDTRHHEQLFIFVHTPPSQFGEPSDLGAPDSSDDP
jgi:hypothetical protein